MLTRIAFRNVLRNRRRSIITLSVIVFGAVGMILFGGYKAVTFQNLRESTIRSRIGHLQILASDSEVTQSRRPLERGLSDVTSLRTTVEKDPRVQMTAAQITLTGLVSNGEHSDTFIATAVEPPRDRQMRAQRLIAGSDLNDTDADAILIGAGLAGTMNATVGDYLTLMTTTTGGSLNAVDVRVSGIFRSGVKEYDDRAIKMPITAAQELLQTSRIEKLLVFLEKTDDTEGVQRDLTAQLASARQSVEMKHWRELAPFYSQVVLLYNGIFGFMGLIVFAIVVFSVANTITMSIFERTREVGTMMALGTSRSRIWRLFFIEGVITGLLGGVLGLAAGALLAVLINNGEVMLPPPPGYTVGYRLQILLEPNVLTTAFLISVVTATLSSILPALRASRLKIVDALGHI